MEQLVYSFASENTQGNSSMKDLLGGKGANLAQMCKLGLPVPPGFTITTEVCNAYYAEKKLPDGLKQQIELALQNLENIVGSKFGDNHNPLLLSVRSGAKVSMPGMMDTILNLGLNDITVKALADKTNNKRFAYDSYRRFIQMYGNVVLDIDHYVFEEILESQKQARNIQLDTELTEDDLEQLVDEYKKKVLKETGKEFPDDVTQQLWGAILAVFNSWMNQRAITYRRLNNIPFSYGTAVNIQSMVFGNMGDDSATGVAFTRDPATGENIFYGEYLINAQGEDVVAGIRTPQSITKLGRERLGSNLLSMQEAMPDIYDQLVLVYKKLELHYKDMQDIEFTVQNNKLWLLQTRSGKRTTKAAIKIAVDMVNEGLITKEQAILRIDPHGLDQLLHPSLDPNAKYNVIARGLPASPGAASGYIVFNADLAAEKAAQGQKVILVRIETSPEDIHGMAVAEAIVTARGGMTSHAAVVARGMGRACVCGASELVINYKEKIITIGNHIIKEGEIISVNGSTGEIILGEVKTVRAEISEEFKQLLKWADVIRKLNVRTNADTPLDAKIARDFGAEGIGLCRTEHMFFDANRILAVREMILSSNTEARCIALDKILPMQREDFKEIFKIMAGLPVTIRLLDPPLHEFLPQNEDEIIEFAKMINLDLSDVKYRLSRLKETNPMLGHRGCRLAITYPEIYETQARAIFEAMSMLKHDELPHVEIMIPFIFDAKELEVIKAFIDKVAQEVNPQVRYIVGTMIELPRAALMAHDIAKSAEFFSFGTNDLTQTTFGLSRDDAANFLPSYKEMGLIHVDPFVRIDEEGVGQLMKIATEGGRATKSNLKVGICGEHGGNPESINLCHRLGLDYVSCSPYRVPIARLSAAIAALK